jgi:CheY-like chemotaxis protein
MTALEPPRRRILAVAASLDCYSQSDYDAANPGGLNRFGVSGAGHPIAASVREGAIMARILVIDDDADLRTITTVFLEGVGHDVVVAVNGAMGLQTLQTASYDLVLCDLFMPDVDGLEVLRELRRLSNDVPVIAMSGGGFSGTVDLLAVARHLGAAEIIEKPFTQRALLRVITQVLEFSP